MCEIILFEDESDNLKIDNENVITHKIYETRKFVNPFFNEKDPE